MVQETYVPRGIQTELARRIGVSVAYVNAIVHGHKRPSRSKSFDLEDACKELGFNVPKELWMFGTSTQIKVALSKIKKI